MMAEDRKLPWSALLGLAAEAAKEWNQERKAQRSIIKLFYEHFVDEQGLLILDRMGTSVADLVFREGKKGSNSRQGTYTEIEVINTSLSGDNPKRLRTFRYSGQLSSSALWTSWPPYFLVTFRGEVS